jgi:pilus assembly protein CpaC
MVCLVAGVNMPVASADEQALVLQVNSGRLLTVDHVTRVVVAAPQIADVNVITRGEVMVLAKQVGETTLSVWDARGLTTYRVLVVGARVEDVQAALAEVLAGSQIRVRIVEDTVVLEGTVLTDGDKQRAESLASPFAKHVIDLLTVAQPAPPAAQVIGTELADALKAYPVQITMVGPDTVRVEGLVDTQYDRAQIEAIAKQYVKNVDLAVRVRAPVQIQIATVIAEIDLVAMRNLGIQYGQGNTSTNVLNLPGMFNVSLFTSPTSPVQALELLVAQIAALESRNAARTLANPRLVVLAGETAKLLVGGQVPIPQVTTNGQVSITYEPFGVRLEFTPVVAPDEPIHLNMLTEVSSLNYAQAVTISGFSIPTITTRRAETSVAMRPGEFLAIGGMIQRTESRVINKLPLLGDIPIIGALFRSVQFQRGETELVIFVSPTIVTPQGQPPVVPAMPNPDTLNP